MQFAVMDPADRDGELITHSAAQCTWLCEREVVRIRRHAAADKAWLPQNELPVVLIAQANGFAQSTDHIARRPFPADGRSLLAGFDNGPADQHLALIQQRVRRRLRILSWRAATGRTVRGAVRGQLFVDFGEPRLKPLLDHFGIWGRQRVLGRQIPMRLGCRLVRLSPVS